jgi:hypothetical protein
VDFPKEIRQHDFETAPRAQGSPGPAGQVVAVATSTTAGFFNLQALTFGETYSMTASDLQFAAGAPAGGPVGVVGSFITIRAETSDVGVIFGATQASVTTTNVPALATVGTVSGAGAYTQAAGVCYRIPAGTEKRFKLAVGTDNFMGFVGSGVGVMRLYMSSPIGLAA